ncbi:TrbI/VirB10 family protein [Sphingosinicella microcystinivorans]|uniref:TrbI/VirB10 family protein n=1 Tax=Sphingosinicella microcystinivorans TaxID=335406 RepID=UPI0022F38E61|nr:TrbI/VirB10 family protein [Sphingosinicella microcystinivorans]WBX83827.1 TrbI/VirB10 family protein [Sphingosinicella microcystinivorans]
MTAPVPRSDPTKQDPETFVLRAKPEPVVRFRKRLIIGVAAMVLVLLAAISWFALSSGERGLPADEAEKPAPRLPGLPDAVSGLPERYDEVPKLGPPLPGDLGRPILKRQREIVSENTAATEVTIPDAAGDARTRAANAPILVRLSGTNARTAGHIAEASNQTPPTETRRPPTPSPYLLSAGSVIAASLITGLNSDLPGLVTAQVTENVFDSPTGRILLVPQGARLLGRYESNTAFGQSRAQVVWQRLVFPDGHGLDLDQSPATDAGGYAGISDRVDRHSGEVVKAVIMSTILGIGSELAIAGNNELADALRSAVQSSGSRAGDQIVSRGLELRPTIIVRPGTPIRLLVHQDLVIEPSERRNSE